VSFTEAVRAGGHPGAHGFLPVSSSGHLALAQNLLGMADLEKNLVSRCCCISPPSRRSSSCIGAGCLSC